MSFCISVWLNAFLCLMRFCLFLLYVLVFISLFVICWFCTCVRISFCVVFNRCVFEYFMCFCCPWYMCIFMFCLASIVISLFLYFWFHLLLSVFMCLYFFMYFCLCVWVSVFMSFCLSVIMSVLSVSVRLSVFRLSLILYVCMPLLMCFCMSLCISVFPYSLFRLSVYDLLPVFHYLFVMFCLALFMSALWPGLCFCVRIYYCLSFCMFVRLVCMYVCAYVYFCILCYIVYSLYVCLSALFI